MHLFYFPSLKKKTKTAKTNCNLPGLPLCWCAEPQRSWLLSELDVCSDLDGRPGGQEAWALFMWGPGRGCPLNLVRSAFRADGALQRQATSSRRRTDTLGPSSLPLTVPVLGPSSKPNGRGGNCSVLTFWVRLRALEFNLTPRTVWFSFFSWRLCEVGWKKKGRGGRGEGWAWFLEDKNLELTLWEFSFHVFIRTQTVAYVFSECTKSMGSQRRGVTHPRAVLTPP